MLQENIRMRRKAMGLSQEEVARRLHITRQTLSKWENGLSVPDAQLLQQLAEVLEVPIAWLLDGPATAEQGDQEGERDTVAQQLERLNLLLAERNRRSRRIWRIVAGILLGTVLLTILLMLMSLVVFRNLTAEPQVSEGGVVTVDDQVYDS